VRSDRRRRSYQPEMNDHGCIHLNNFKAAKGIQPYKVIHSFFVTSTSTEARIRKVTLVCIVHDRGSLPRTFQGIFPTLLLLASRFFLSIFFSFRLILFPLLLTLSTFNFFDVSSMIEARSLWNIKNSIWPILHLSLAELTGDDGTDSRHL